MQIISDFEGPVAINSFGSLATRDVDHLHLAIDLLRPERKQL